MGIATSAGADAVVHGIRRRENLVGNNPEFALLSVDENNAFNLCRRSAFLEDTKSNFPQLLLWIVYCKNSGPEYLRTGSDIMRNIIGSE